MVGHYVWECRNVTCYDKLLLTHGGEWLDLFFHYVFCKIWEYYVAFISKSWHFSTISMIARDLGKHISPSVYASYSIINLLFYSMFACMYHVINFEIIFKNPCTNIIVKRITPFLVLSEFHTNFIFRHNFKTFRAKSALLRRTGHLYFYLYFNIQQFSFSWKNEIYSYKKCSRVRLGQQS